MPIGSYWNIPNKGGFWNDSHAILPKKNIKEEVRELQNRGSGGNDSNSNGSAATCQKSQTIWQKATSLRQSLRQSSRSKVGQKAGFDFPNLPTSEKSATLGTPSSVGKAQDPQIRREWKSQRNLARERRSFASKPSTTDELAAAKRSLHSRSLCMSGDWDVDTGAAVTTQNEQPPPPLSLKEPRSPRKLTKDSGYETSVQCDPDYANSISDWFSQEKALDKIDDERLWNNDNHVRNLKNNGNNEKRLEWNTRNRPLSFSHQEVASERAKNYRQLRHSYSQREVSRHIRQDSVDSLATSSTDIKKHLATSVESINTFTACPAVVTKSTPVLAQNRSQRLSTSSTGSLLQSEPDEAGGGNMVTRRFKKGSVYDALASTSGLDFSPVVQLKTFNRRDDASSEQGTKPSDKIWESTAKFSRSSPSKDSETVFYKEKSMQESPDASSSSSNSSNSQENQNSFPTSSIIDGNDSTKCIAAHEKYPSWPVTAPSSSAVTHRSHSWTGQTDYPKEKIAYSRPKKSNQFKISTNQLQPVLERASDYNSNKSSPERYCSSDGNNGAENFSLPYQSCNTTECNSKQFDFDAFQTPCIPQCYEEKDYRIHSPPERDMSSASSVTGSQDESRNGESNGFLSRYEDVLRHQAQYSVPLSSAWERKPRSADSKGLASGPDTPFLDRLRLESAWQMPPPPVPMIPAAGGPQQAQPQQQQLQQQQQGNDFELSSENGTWMGSMESSSHGRGIPKWQGSYSDLSTLSTQLSNRSSLFDSGHSTMPESGRLSPQSSCDSTAPSLLLEGPTRAQVVARHGCHREIIAHSARVQQPERHGSESVLYYATGPSSRLNGECKIGSKKLDATAASGSIFLPDGAMYRSHASVTLSPSQLKSNSREVPDCQNKTNKCPSRQDSRKSSNSFSSEDSFPRTRSHCGDDTSGSSSDISNITCISNSKGTAKSKSLDEASPSCDIMKPVCSDQSVPSYKTGYEQPKSKSMDETTRKFVFPDGDKRQRISDPDLKAIQKQAVMSFYQRMSLAESIKSEQKSGHQAIPEKEPPPPYEATPSSRKNMYAPKLSLMPKKFNSQWETRKPIPISPQTHLPIPKPSDTGLLNHHSKSVPNLVALKGQNLEVPPSHPMYKRAYSGSSWTNANNDQGQQKKGSPLAKDEIISWDQLPNVLEKKREAIEKAAFSTESKDPPEDNGGCSSGMHYFKSHKSPRKVQLKEVHHSNETASVKVMTPDGVTLVQTHEQRRDDKLGAAPPPPHKRRPAPPPPPKQPPKRPPPPPPPVTPPPQVVVVLNGNESENAEELRIDVAKSAQPSNHLSSSASSPQLGIGGSPPPSHPPSTPSCCGRECPSSPDLPLPPPPQSQGSEIMPGTDEPLPPPPESTDVNVEPRMLDSSSLIYPKNSYMSYRSERKLGRQGFDGQYRRSFHTSASSVDLTTLGSSFQDGKDGCSPNSWEEMHNIRQHGTTVIFHSDCLQPENRLQRSSSQDCVLVEEPASNKTDNISNSKPQESECKQSSISISNTQCSNNQGVPPQSVPYSPASQENNTKISSSDSHQNDITKVTSSQNPDNVVTNNDTANDDTSSLDNRILTDDSFVETESDTSCFTNVDHNQNAMKNNITEENNSKLMNGSDLNRINSATQTNNTPKIDHKTAKTKEEIECEQLSMDFVNHCGDNALKNLLIPSPNHKTISDYMEGLLNLELETGGFPVQRNHVSNNVSNNENKQRDEKWRNNERCNSLFNSKMRISQCMEMNDNQCTEDEVELKKRKEELIQSIERKVDTLRNEQTNIREEMLQNELLGQEIASRLQKVAKPNELEKYSLHVEEIEKIVNLLLSLSGRLARAENILKNMPKEGSAEEKKILEAKREKLREQHEDARRLKESIDRRSNQVSTFLHKYFTDVEYADYDRFIKLKTKLIVDIRELDEKINLGEEQLAALSVVAHLWKSANS